MTYSLNLNKNLTSMLQDCNSWARDPFCWRCCSVTLPLCLSDSDCIFI